MITNIIINNIASYSQSTELSDLKKINFIFGCNGTGKTTLSKIISNPSEYSSCSLSWIGNEECKTLVLNDDFKDKYFYQSNELKGIFGLGEDVKENEGKIKELVKQKESIEQEIFELSEKLNSNKKNKERVENNFKDLCWNKIYFKYKNDFSNIFKGFKNSKEKLTNEIINKYRENEAELYSYDNLKKKYTLLFDEELEILNELEVIDKDIIDEIKVLEKDEIFRTNIIGKQDVDISEMITKLQNHDWVKQGKEYYEKNYDESKEVYICPFCQQSTSKYFKESLEEYFDERYINQIDELNQISQKYESKMKELEEYFANIFAIEGNKYLQNKIDHLEDLKNSVDVKIQLNKKLIEDKQANPSNIINLQSILEFLKKNEEIINAINKEILEHNNTVNNWKIEEQNLKKSIWNFFGSDILSDLKRYKKDLNDLEKSEKSIGIKIRQNTQNIKDLDNQMNILEKKIKSIKPIAVEINRLLKNFGFTGFTLEVTDDNRHYKIIRSNGEPAKESLSEGERNLVVFLYFYNLLTGAIDPDENINDKKIVVFDDPVSSFDANVLFLVSTLIKDLIKSLRDGKDSNIKQIFVLTHNVYFFKEITFFSYRDQKNARNDTMYFIVKKHNEISGFEKYDRNPIQTTYQLLWENVKSEENDLVSIQNNMRRIIEFYFKILANISDEEIVNHFTDINEKIICSSLIAWMNAGSHDVFDDIHIDSIQGCGIGQYQNIFKLIFERTNHLAHYNMMMNEPS